MHQQLIFIHNSNEDQKIKGTWGSPLHFTLQFVKVMSSSFLNTILFEAAVM